VEHAVADNGERDSNGAAGAITLDELLVGEYTITQVGIPDGYEAGSESQRAVVTGQGQDAPVAFVNPAVAPAAVDEDEVTVEEPVTESVEEPVDAGGEDAEEPRDGDLPVTVEADEPANEATDPVDAEQPAEDAPEPFADEPAELAVEPAADDNESRDAAELGTWYGDGRPAPGQEVALEQASFPAKTVPLAAPVFTPLADVPIGTVQARMRNQQPTSGNCIRYAPTTPGGGQSAWVTNTGEAQTAHGSSNNNSCPTNLSTNTQSVLGFNPVATTTVATGTPFLLGRMSHYNNPVYANDQYFTGELDVQFAGLTLNFPWLMNETPNVGGDVDDITTFTGQIADQVIDVDGIPHRLVVLGFTQSETTQCPETPDGAYVNEFLTEERTTTHGCLYAQLTQVRTLQVAKVVDNAGGTPIPNFPFTTTSTLAGSPWNSSFGLQPTGEGEENAATTDPREVLAGAESVTITETLPGGWHLTTAACVDGLGNEVPSTLTGTTVNLAQIPAASSPAELPIVCTIHNARTYEQPTISKTATPSYAVNHLWDIAKDVDQSEVRYPAGSDVPELNYTVEVSPVQRVESDWVVTGSINVNNPNAVSIEGQLVDAVNNGGTCNLDSGGSTVTVQPGSNTFDYTCTYESAPAPLAGQNTATLSWDTTTYPGTTGEASAVAPFDFGSVDPDPNVNETITVSDDLAEESPWTIVWPEDGQSVTELSYSIPATGTPGECTTIDNTATIQETGQSDSTETEVCVGMDLEVAKNVLLSLDRTYTYDLDKSVNATELNVDPETGDATFTYTVTVTDGPFTDSNWQMTGQITVDNPNDWDMVADVTDTVDNGGVCTVVDGEDATIPANGSAVLDYSCAFDDQPEYDGTNTATVTWDEVEYFSPNGEATGSVDFDEDDWSVTPINETVTVIDDQTDPANPVELGDHTWTAEGATEDFTYDLVLEGVPGECVTFTNNAWLEELPTIGDDQTVTVCWPEAITVEKTVDADFDREYHWLLDKAADQTEVTIGEDGIASFDYVVSATPNGFTDSDWMMTGQITVTNPNATDVTVQVTDVPADLGAEATCTVDDPELTVPADGTATTTYTCTFDEAPVYDGGTNTATVTWTDISGDPQTASSAPADVDFEVDGQAHLTVPVYDDKVTLESPGELLGIAHYYDGPHSFAYTMTHPGVAGECTPYTNTAVIPELGQDDPETVRVCVVLAPEVEKTAQASYDRLYEWDIEKDVDETRLIADPETGTATFTYTVNAIPLDYVDSGWTMSGQITVTNPNSEDIDALTATVTDLADVGGECTVTGGEDLLLAPGDSVTLDYTCTFEEEPDYSGTNTATADWTGPAQTGGSAEGTVPVTFEEGTVTDLTVEVWDDQTDPEGDPVYLGEAIWTDPDTHEFTYDLALAGVPGECVDYTNTAWVELADGPGAEDEQQVTVCSEAGPEVSKTVDASYDRTYDWELTKVVDATEVEITGTEATFNYLVTAIADGFVDSGWEMTGQITVTNPNEFDDGALTVTVTDLTDVGGTCVVEDGEDVTIAPGATETFDYTCTFDEQPAYEGTNTAYVAWTDTAGEPQTTTGTADVDFVLDEETNLTVDVYDDQVFEDGDGVLLGTANWHDSPVSFPYELTLPGTPGECVTHTNTAVIPDTGDEATADVTICVEDELVITKTAEADFDREYFWSLQKEADRTQVTIDEGGTAEFNYVVSAIPGAFEDSGWAMSGQITVTNPNEYDEGTVTVEITDVTDVGGTCEVIDGEGIVIAPGATEVFDYVCSFDEQPDYEGTNTATVTWTGPDQEPREVSFELPVVFELDEETNLTVDVYDDKVTGVAPGELLGEATWNAEGTPIDFEYAMEFPGVVGECTDYTNTAVIPATGDETDETVTVCVEAGPEVSKTADASFDREYFWEILKEADQTQVTITEGGTAQFDYVVSANPDGSEDSGWAMSGQITVTNPNDFDTMRVTVTDVTDVGGTCEVVGGESAVLEPGETRAFDYSCTFEEQPLYEGTNVAYVAWTDAAGEEQSTASLPAVVAFDLDGETNLEVDVYDDKVTGVAPGELLGTANWLDGGEDFEYSMEFPGVVGECTDYTNTAVIPATGDEADETVTVCVEAGPEVSKTAEADFDRTYDWLIEKEVDRTHVVLAEDGTAHFEYVVSAVPNGFEDSGWAMSGQITVTNPNGFEEMAVTVTDLADVGGTCEVVDGEGVVLEPDETRVFDYACTFEEQPDYEGSNTAYVVWTDAAGEEQTATGQADVEFALDEEINVTVDVYDDKVTGEAPGELLGTANWHDGRTEFSYGLDLPGEVGTCVDHTNTAVILKSTTLTGFVAPQAIGDEDEVTVTVCIEAAPEVSKTAEADFDRTYDWELEKSVDRTEVRLEEAGDALFNYVVTATPDGFVDSGWAMGGQITVTNPNDFQEMTVTVTDVADVGGTCEVVDGEGVVLAPGETRVLDYSCTFEEQPDYEGSNTAYVAWTNVDGVDQTTASDPVDVVFALDEETNVEVEVFDDLVTGEAPGELLGTANWHEGVTEFAYSLELPGVVGECVDYTNTAVIPATGDEAQQTVTVCVDEPEPPVPPKPEPPKPPVIPTGDPVSGGPQWALVVAGITAMILALLGAGAMLWRRREE